MSAVGFDFGNGNCIVAVARQRGINVALNNESKCETPAVICFSDKQRLIGTAGAASAIMNPKNTISQVKRLLGRPFSDPELQRDLKSLPFTVTVGLDGFPLIHVRDLRENRTYTPTQVLGILFSSLKGIAEKNLNATVADCCIGIPVYFTDLQRKAILEAATIAGLHPLQLIHETTATAMAYAIHHRDLSENDPVNVAFIDIGHSSMQVSIAGIKKDKLKILAHSFDRNLGGRDFDEVLFQHFAAELREEYKIDVIHNARACLRLRAACEKLKKLLSANPEASSNIQGLRDKQDVRVFIKREEFEEISVRILERVKKPLVKALAEAGLGVENIHAVEVVGSASRIPAILKILTEFFGKEPRRTMNASESVAYGCALKCAILSPALKVKGFQVIESFPFAISMSLKGHTREAQTEAKEDQRSTIIIPKGSPIPSLKAVTIRQMDRLTVDLQYADMSSLQAPARISTYVIGPFPSVRGDCIKLEVKVRLNLHGIVSVDSAAQIDTYAKAVAPRKTKVYVSEVAYGVLSQAEVQEAVEKEFATLQDRVMEEAKDWTNARNAYVNNLRPGESYQCALFSFSDLEKATNYFDPSLKIGEGGYGSIYRGILYHTEVAIKILHLDSMQGPREFQQEVEVLSKLRHPNMVTLIGACPDSWTLIYEYLHGGSLEDQLNCKDNSPALPWQTRIRIATELCSALIFLHSSQPSSIIHGDLNPSNILLDVNFVCKLSDFGICRLISNGEISTEQTMRFFTTQPKGTFSYLDPEFVATGELTTMSDVYSFGIILLRLLTGKPALGIAKKVQYALDNGDLNSMLDPSAGDWPFVQAKQLARMALRCCDMNRRNRPDLAAEVWMVLHPMKASCQRLSTLRRVGYEQAPFYFICPIFQEIMEDPHIAADGYTYEAEAIRGWLDSGHDTSPMTNTRLDNFTLVPNRALRSAIQEWLQHNRIV